MKLINKALFKFFTAVIILAAFGQIKAQNHESTVKYSSIIDSGKKITLSKGRILILTLKNHVDGGFRYTSPKYDNKILVLLKNSSKSPAQNGPIGAPGTETWQFQALRSGKTSLKVFSMRPFGQKESIFLFCLSNN